MNDWLDAEQRVERAQQLFECHRWDEALTELDAALAINSNSALWHAQRGYALEELQRDADAAEAYQRSLSLDPQDNEVAYALGATLARLGRLARALEIFEDLARRDPQLEAVYCHRIQLYAELGRHEQAEEVFYLAQQINDECPDCFFNMGGSLAARGEHDRAIFCWRKTLELDPSYLGVNRRIGESYRAKGQPELARECLLKELRDDPGNTDLLYELASLALQMGDAPAAVAKLDQLLELEPMHGPARMLLGKVRLRGGQPQLALECFERLRDDVRDGPDRAELECASGEALLRLGRYADARARLEFAREADPNDLRALVLLGDANLALNRPGAAADSYRRLLSVDGDNPFAHHRLAVCLLKMKQPGPALTHCEQALMKRPDFVEAMYHAALAHLRLAHWRKAREWMTRAEKAAPANTAIQQLRRTFWRFRLRHYLRFFTS